MESLSPLIILGRILAKTLAIDFDGVIHKYSLGWHDGTIYDGPVDGAFQVIRALMGDYTIVIHTSRDIKQVRDWLKLQGFTAVASNDIRFWEVSNALLVTNMKPAAIAYIDDRAFKFTNWDDVLKEFG